MLITEEKRGREKQKTGDRISEIYVYKIFLEKEKKKRKKKKERI